MCQMCSLDLKLKAFEEAWLMDEDARVCFSRAEDENGILHTFREALITYIQEVIPQGYDWSVHSSGYINDDYSCIYIEVYNSLSNYNIPYIYVFNVEV